MSARMMVGRVMVNNIRAAAPIYKALGGTATTLDIRRQTADCRHTDADAVLRTSHTADVLAPWIDSLVHTRLVLCVSVVTWDEAPSGRGVQWTLCFAYGLLCACVVLFWGEREREGSIATWAASFRVFFSFQRWSFFTIRA